MKLTQREAYRCERFSADHAEVHSREAELKGTRRTANVVVFAGISRYLVGFDVGLR